MLQYGIARSFGGLAVPKTSASGTSSRGAKRGGQPGTVADVSPGERVDSNGMFESQNRGRGPAKCGSAKSPAVELFEKLEVFQKWAERIGKSGLNQLESTQPEDLVLNVREGHSLPGIPAQVPTQDWESNVELIMDKAKTELIREDLGRKKLSNQFVIEPHSSTPFCQSNRSSDQGLGLEPAARAIHCASIHRNGIHQADEKRYGTLIISDGKSIIEDDDGGRIMMMNSSGSSKSDPNGEEEVVNVPISKEVIGEMVSKHLQRSPMREDQRCSSNNKNDVKTSIFTGSDRMGAVRNVGKTCIFTY